MGCFPFDQDLLYITKAVLVLVVVFLLWLEQIDKCCLCLLKLQINVIVLAHGEPVNWTPLSPTPLGCLLGLLNKSL